MKTKNVDSQNVRKRFPVWILMVVLLLATYGCYAAIKATEVDPAKPDETEGLRYFLPVPYLIVEQIDDQRWTAKIELGVDRSREFAVQPYTAMAKSTATVEFNTDGTLKSFQLDQDTTKVAEAVVDALKEVELKRLELEKEALGDRIKSAQQKSPGLQDEKPTKEKRQIAVEIYRIKGKDLVPQNASLSLMLPVSPKVPQEPSPSTELTGLTVTSENDRVVVEGIGRELTQKDIQKMGFNSANGDPLSDPETKRLQNLFQLDAPGKLFAKKSDIQPISGGRIVIGTAAVNIPKLTQ